MVGGNSTKLKILSLDWTLENKSIISDTLPSENSLDEFDVLLINPLWIDSTITRLERLNSIGKLEFQKIDIHTYRLPKTYWNHFGKKIYGEIIKTKTELKNVIGQNKGIIICKILPQTPILELIIPNGGVFRFDRYSFFPSFVDLHDIDFPDGIEVIAKKGTIYKVESKSPSIQFFDAFKNEIKFRAIIKELNEELNNGFFERCEILAKNKTGEVIAIEVPIDSGRIVLLPDLKEPDPKKEAGVFLDIISNIFEGPVFETPPEWVSEYTLSGQEILDKEIEKIEEEIKLTNDKLKNLQDEKYSIIKYKSLLWGTGKRNLETVVRDAFRLIGFKVPKEEEYEEDYDVLLYSDEGNAIGEVEGSEKHVDVKKYRQLLDYVEKELEKDNNVKGILIGNGFRLVDPKERDYQFTEPAKKGCERRDFCLISTSSLYKIVETILKNPGDEKFKLDIRKNILECKGDFDYDFST